MLRCQKLCMSTFIKQIYDDDMMMKMMMIMLSKRLLPCVPQNTVTP